MNGIQQVDTAVGKKALRKTNFVKPKEQNRIIYGRFYDQMHRRLQNRKDANINNLGKRVSTCRRLTPSPAAHRYKDCILNRNGGN